MATVPPLRATLNFLLLEDVEETGKELGRGAYGVVTEVKVAGLVCAGKKIHDAIVQESTLDKFGKECICHSRQCHPNIVQLMGVYYPPSSQLPMLVMEYLPLSLTQCLETHRDLSLQFKYSILLDVAKGLAYLHRKRPPIVHRDLTANNILLTSNFMAKISDLGVSRMVDTFRQRALTTAPGAVIVMAPEALKPNPQYNHKLDVFSYGCLILHVLTGQFPAPSARFVQSGVFKSPKKVKEWDRRSRYIEQIPKENELLPFAKQCLTDQPTGRPEMIEAVEFIEVFQVPMKSNIEMMIDIGNKSQEITTLSIKNKELEETFEAEKAKKEEEVSKLQSTVDELHKRTINLTENLENATSELKFSLSLKEKEMIFQLLKSQKESLNIFEHFSKGLQALFKSSTIPSPIENTIKNLLCREQRELMQPFLAKKQKKGDKMYLVSSSWFKKWKKYTEENVNSCYPGPVYNTDLLTSDQITFMIEGLDYELLPEAAWDLLVQWYGLAEESKPIVRFLIEHNGYLEIEDYSFYLNFCVHPHFDNVKRLSFGHLTFISEVVTVAKELFNIPLTTEVRLWRGCAKGNYELLIMDEQNLLTSGTTEGQTLLLEVKELTGIWPRTIGLVGLTKNYDTPFFNSLIQCLINTTPLTDYFIRKRKRAILLPEDVPPEKITVVEAYANLMHEIKSGQKSCSNTSQLRNVFEKMGCKFDKDPQSDIKFFLETLHSELKLIGRNKRLLGDNEYDVLPGAFTNQSVIVRLFYLQSKITTTCVKCNKQNPKLETTSVFSLPSLEAISVYLVKVDPSARPIECCVSVPKNGNILILKNAIQEMTGICSSKLVVVRIKDSRFHHLYYDHHPLSELLENNIYLYEIQYPHGDPDWVPVSVYMRQSDDWNLFGFPIIVSVPRIGCTYRNLYDTIIAKISSRYLIDFQESSKDLFELVVVDKLGFESRKLSDGDELVKLKSDTYIGCNWETDVKNTYYDVEESEARVVSLELSIPRAQLVFYIKEYFKEWEDNKVANYCTWCESSEVVRRKRDLTELTPEIFIFNLKRDGYKGKFLFPFEGLDLSEYVQSDTVSSYLYDLYAVCNYHEERNHYTAYVKNNDNSKWYCFDDENVFEIDLTPERFCSPAACVLFYQKRRP